MTRSSLGQFTAMVTQDVLPPGMVTVPNIPAFADNYRLTSIQPIRQATTLYTFQPHMHLRGKSMKYTAVYPDGREEVLINVPKYDFNWQIIYQLAEPITLPAGSVIRVDAVWDNSPKNSTTRSPNRTSAGASRAGTRCSVRSSAPRSSCRVPVVPVALQSQR